MDDEAKQSEHQKPTSAAQGPAHYRVASVHKSTGPGGAEGDDWHRYVLTGGRSAITGWCRGTREEVTEHAARCADEFNARSDGKRNPHWSRRTPAPKPKSRTD